MRIYCQSCGNKTGRCLCAVWALQKAKRGAIPNILNRQTNIKIHPFFFWKNGLFTFIMVTENIEHTVIIGIPLDLPNTESPSEYKKVMTGVKYFAEKNI